MEKPDLSLIAVTFTVLLIFQVAFRTHDLESLVDICSLLVSYGCNISGGGSIPPLQCAVYWKSPSTVAALLSARLKFPDIISRALTALDSVSGYAPLHTAVRYGTLECARLLIDAGADVNVWSRDMNTPLELAVMTCNKDAVQLLLQYPSCQVDKVGSKHATALRHAVVRGLIVLQQQKIRLRPFFIDY